MSEVAWKPKVNPWIIAVAVTLATFMEVLDTSIANVSLPHIAGGLGASYDETTWVITCYLVSNAVALPISAYLTTLFGCKRLYMTCVLDLRLFKNRTFAVSFVMMFVVGLALYATSNLLPNPLQNLMG